MPKTHTCLSFRSKTPDKVMSISGGTMAASSSSGAGAIPQYATTVTNVTFAYGRGKKAVNALNDITIKVPVGSM